MFFKWFQSQQLTYMEFSELYNLAEVQMVTDADSRLTPMLYQSISWYQSLIKLLISKYWDHYRLFVSPDANTQHLLILHPKFLEGFVMLTVDAQSGRGVGILITQTWSIKFSFLFIHNSSIIKKKGLMKFGKFGLIWISNLQFVLIRLKCEFNFYFLTRV